MKPKNGVVANEKPESMMNLLDSTDSDVEWLSLPPIKGKKPKKKKYLKPITNRVNSSCSMWNVLKGFLLFAVIAAICLLSIVITWMSGEIIELRERLKTVDSRSDSSVQDLNTLMVKLSDVNKTIHTIQSGKNSLSDVIQNISSINHEISELSYKVNKLDESLQAAPEIRQIPEKLLTVSKTVADLGSEVAEMKGQVDTFSQFKKTTDTELEEISNKLNSQTSDNTDLSPDVAHLIQGIPDQLTSLNISLLTQMSLLQSTLIEHEQRFAVLENTTATLGRNISSISQPSMSALPESGTTDLRTQVGDIIQQLMENTTSPVSGMATIDKNTLTLLLANMDNLTTTVQRLKEDYGKLVEEGTGSSTGDIGDNDELKQLLRTIGDTSNMKITLMNTSLANLQHDFDHYITIIGQHSNKLVTIEHEINEIHRFLRQPPVNTTRNPETTTPAEKEKLTTTKSPGTEGSVSGGRGEEKVTEHPEGPSSTTPVQTPGEGTGAGRTVVTVKVGGGTTKAPAVEMSPTQTPSPQQQEKQTPSPQQQEKQTPSPQQQEKQTPSPQQQEKQTLSPQQQEKQTPSPQQQEKQTPSPQQQETTKTWGPIAAQGLTTRRPGSIRPPSSIKNIDDLELNFRRWDMMGNGKVLYGVLPDFLGPETPPEKDLEKFDANGDGLYSLRELATAFGFNFEDLPADNIFRTQDKEEGER